MDDLTAPLTAPLTASLTALRARHWRRTRNTTAVLLALWLLTSFFAVFFARELSGMTLFGWPLSFYLAAQGASLAYLAIIGAYAWRMRCVDRDYLRCADLAARARSQVGAPPPQHGDSNGPKGGA